MHTLKPHMIDAARKYADENPSDPFAFRRAISRFRTFGEAKLLDKDGSHYFE